jgi:hypothetical protein
VSLPGFHTGVWLALENKWKVFLLLLPFWENLRRISIDFSLSVRQNLLLQPLAPQFFFVGRFSME